MTLPLPARRDLQLLNGQVQEMVGASSGVVGGLTEGGNIGRCLDAQQLHEWMRALHGIPNNSRI